TKGLFITAGLLGAFLLNYPLAQAALVAAGLLLLSRRIRSERFFSRVDWEDGALGARHVLAPLVSPETGLLRFAPAERALS
ncbi:hypothetical protein ABTD04_20610, partial [Acinetobacter baumannii]